MALIAAIVGGVALSGVLSLNVLDRRREIGVMRAIGASSSVIARLMTRALSNSINTELIYDYSGMGVLYWLAIITLLSMLASWFPAQKAAQPVSVRAWLMFNQEI